MQTRTRHCPAGDGFGLPIGPVMQTRICPWCGEEFEGVICPKCQTSVPGCDAIEHITKDAKNNRKPHEEGGPVWDNIVREYEKLGD